MGSWRPVQRGGWSFVQYLSDDEAMELSPPKETFALGKDGTPLRFWGTKQAQIKADALNRKLAS